MLGERAEDGEEGGERESDTHTISDSDIFMTCLRFKHNINTEKQNKETRTVCSSYISNWR